METNQKSNYWLGVISFTLGAFAMVTMEFMPVGILPEVAKAFSISSGKAGLMMTFPGLLAALSAPGVLILAGNLDRKHVIVGLSALLVIACALAVFATSFEIMLLSRAMVGISLGAFWALSLSVAGRLVTNEHVDKATAAVFSGVTVAMILGLPFGTYIAELFSWRGAFIATGGLALLALIMELLTIPHCLLKGD